MVDPAPETLPKAVRGTPLDTDDGVQVPAQQTVGADAVAGGGEWPDPNAPAQAPAPGAVEEPDDEPAEVPTGDDSRVNRVVERALSLAEEETAEADAASELHAAAGGDSELLEAAERLMARHEAAEGPESSRAAAYLAAARTI